MNYKTLYRRWRPRDFSNIVGQQHITRTLQNSLIAGRVSHAYLFCGTRGTGKTTTAKVLAMALNCVNRLKAEPCNNCASCVSIVEGHSMDVVEIDAASNRGIDEIRDLKEKIHFSPTTSKYRVYIIDEVHMLTNEAFNALLKTLEEPPAHVIFILATTEPHKVPVTILSRCQRFDFRPISVEEMVERLQEVAEGSKLNFDKDALQLLARAAEGSLRDALSMMDQVSSNNKSKITEDDIHAILGSVQRDLLHRMTQGLLEGNIIDLIDITGNIVATGKDLRVFARQLGVYLRDLLMNSLRKTEKGTVSSYDRQLLFHIIKLLVQYEQDMRWNMQPQLLFELFLFEAVEGSGEDDIGDIALRLARLEKQVNQLAGSYEGKQEVKQGVKSEGFSLLNVESFEDADLYEDKNDINIMDEPGSDKTDISDLSFTGEIEDLSDMGDVVENINVPQPDTTSIDRVKHFWPQVLKEVKKHNKATYAYLKSSWPSQVSGSILTLGYEDGDIARDIMDQDNNKKILAHCLSMFFKNNWTIRCIDGLKRPKEWQEENMEMDINSAMELFSAEKVEEVPPEE